MKNEASGKKWEIVEKLKIKIRDNEKIRKPRYHSYWKTKSKYLQTELTCYEKMKIEN